MTGTGKWRTTGVPHKGWSCTGMEDLGAPGHVCEMCEAQVVRYVHTMAHPDVSFTLDVGCMCAGHMEQDRAAAHRRETEFVQRLSRRSRWLTREWRRSSAGNEFLNTEGFNVVIYRRSGAWGARVANRVTGVAQFSRRLYPTVDDAKLAAFDAMLRMKG